MSIKYKKFLIVLLPMFILFVLFISYLLFSPVSDATVFERCLGEMPNSVNNLKVGGVASMAGANVRISFRIAPKDLENIINRNNYVLANKEFLSGSETLTIKPSGEKIFVNTLDNIKAKAKQMGVVPGVIYMEKGSKFSNYKLMLVNPDKDKVYFVYVKH